MKKFILVLSVLFIISCNKEENSEELLIQQEEFVSVSENVDALRRLALDFKATADGRNGIELDEKSKLRLRKLADVMLSDVKIREASVASKCIYGASLCDGPYEDCIWWAASWDNLLRKCNGPVADRPFNCDQIREDYLANIDEIEATYIRCTNSFNSCISNACGGGGPQGPL
ncbi:hypothetical protein AWE51_19535 [Aquimarina aggregata]|uniref:Lipoprotein n=1 Tax=Aquimarina aggregata TaxID=1642818 RepID=A0A162WQ68_9FLAO|nr:hypothetical protein [Aquimarina aggregata]KZS38231.1 hypothetical protein AWE51_19535 [Aquimarina aggregata]